MSVPDPDVRFSLANERTLLAYQRTSVALLAGAAAVAHFLAGWLAVVIAVAFAASAVVALGGGYAQYVRTDRAIRSGAPTPRGATAHALTLGLMICAIAVGLYVLTA